MKKYIRKTIAYICAAALAGTAVTPDLPKIENIISAENISASGSCGENCTWSFDETTGTLTISGSGDMENYNSLSDMPWYSYCENIKSIIIENGVTSIGDNAFYNCSNLTSITISDSVTSIGIMAFGFCRNLISIKIPKSVTSIGGGAFFYCCDLTSITIPDGVTSIGEGAFYNCMSLKSIKIPNGVTSIGKEAFSDCSELTDVYYSGTETEWNSIEIGSDNGFLINATIHYNNNSSADDSGSCGENCTWS
ncbi:MAG: leucine-rich repeat domain-containing protein, partial [Oscillospiraceae bacterium]